MQLHGKGSKFIMSWIYDKIFYLEKTENEELHKKIFI